MHGVKPQSMKRNSFVSYFTRITIQSLLTSLFMVWLLSLTLVSYAHQFEPTKVFVFYVGGIIVLSYELLSVFRSRFIVTTTTILWGAWVTILTIAGSSTLGPARTFFGSDFRHEGVLFFFLLFWIGYRLSHMSKKARQYMQFGLLFVTVLESLIVLYMYWFDSVWKMYSYKGPLGTLGEPNSAASIIGFGLLFLPNTKKRLWYEFGLMVISGTALFVLHSWVGWIIWAIAVLRRTRSTHRFLKRHVHLLSYAMALGIVLPTLYIFIHAPVPSQDSRYAMWHMSIAAIIHRPLGYGPDATDVALNNAFVAANAPLFGLLIERAHNIWLDIALWSGIPGIIIFIHWLKAALTEASLDHEDAFGVYAWLVFASFHPVGIIQWLYLLYIVNLRQREFASKTMI